MKRKRRIIPRIFNLVLICLLLTCCGKTTHQEDLKEDKIVSETVIEKSEESLDEIQNELEQAAKEEIVEEEQKPSLLDTLGRGINIGNSLDCHDEWNEQAEVTETYWGNPEISEEYVDALIKTGFKTIRIPITWYPHIHDNKIDEAFMSRVKEVVDYAYNRGANVIIDIHHDKKFAPSYGNYGFAKEYLETVWSQVAEEFKDYDERLIFEGINEPRFYGTSDEWTDGTPEGADNTNKLMADFVSVVRKSGGNNSTRLLLITCYCNRSGGIALNRIDIPNDDNIAISVHSYDPYEFTSSGGYRTFDEGLKSQFDGVMNNLKSFMKSSGVPVIITEWGTYESVGKENRIEYLNYVLTKLDAEGIPAIWWDNGNCYGYGAYGLFNRWSLEPYDQDVVNAIFASSKEN